METEEPIEPNDHDRLRDQQLREEEMERLMLEQEREQEENAEEPRPAPLAPMLFEQPAPVKRFSYCQSSYAVAIALLYYALRSRQQWYLAMVYLSSSKIALVVVGNALVAFAVQLFDFTTGVFLNGLRLHEAEGLQDYFRWNITELVLALTMFRSELKARTCVEFLGLVWIKCIHQVAILRENHVRMTQESVYYENGIVVPRSVLKLFLLLILLQWLDLWLVQYTAADLVQRGPSVNILFSFEAAILLVASWSHLLLALLHALDGILHVGHEQNWPFRSLLHPWKECKATMTFAVELQAQAIQFLFYLTFFAIVLTHYGMPINLFREVYLSFTALKERLQAFLKYRRLMASMNRFQNASDEQLDQAGRICIICRDEMTVHDCKVLPGCHHLFHKSCLREWLVQQQSCPTCRSDIVAMEMQEAARNAAAVAAEQREQQEAAGEGAADEPAPTDDTPELVSDATDPQALSTERNDGPFTTDNQATPKASPDGLPMAFSLPALYRITSEPGAPVWNNTRTNIKRVIPTGAIVLCQERDRGFTVESSVAWFSVPDGWILADSVEHVYSIRAASEEREGEVLTES